MQINEEDVRHARDLMELESLDSFERWIDICDDVKVVDSDFNSILHCAAKIGNVKALVILLDLGLDVEARNHQMETPLLCAAARSISPLPVLQALRLRGVSFACRNASDQTVFDILAERNLGDVVLALQQREKDDVPVESTGEAPKEAQSAIARGRPVVGNSTPQTAGFEDTSLQKACVCRSEKSKSSDRRLHVSFEDEKRLLSAPKPVSDEPNLSPKETSFSNSPHPMDHAGIEKDLLILELKESCARGLIVNAYLEELFALCLTSTSNMHKIINPFLYNQLLASSLTHSDMSMEVKILGERHATDGNVLLLVAFRGLPGAKSLSGNFNDTYEEMQEFSAPIWIPLDDVRQLEEGVQRYMKQFEGTFLECSNGFAPSEIAFTSMEATDYSGKRLDEEERNALEQELRQLPKRYNGSCDTSAGALFMSYPYKRELPPLYDDQEGFPEDTQSGLDPSVASKWRDLRQPPTPPPAAAAPRFLRPVAWASSTGPTAAAPPLKGASTLPTPAPAPAAAQAEREDAKSLSTPPPPRLGGRSSASSALFPPTGAHACPAMESSSLCKSPEPVKTTLPLLPLPQDVVNQAEDKSYRLSDNQRLQYEKFLHRSALNALKQKKTLYSFERN